MKKSIEAEKVVPEDMAYIMMNEWKDHVNDQKNVLDVRAGHASDKI